MISKVHKKKNNQYHTMMNRILFSLLMGLLCPFVMAQPGGQHPGNHPHPSSNPSMANHSIVLMAAHGEEFVVYVDGDVMNRRPESTVKVVNLTPGPHDVYVLLKRPADKITMQRIVPNTYEDTYVVLYNSKTGKLDIVQSQPRPQPHAQPQPQPQPQMQPQHHPQTPPVCTYEEVEQMYQLMVKESFEDSRMALGKNIVSNKRLTATQIKRLTESFTFENNKLEFLKYAYAYCVDPQNYFQCVDVLTFSSNKEQLLKFIGH